MLGMQSNVAVYESADGEVRVIVALLQDSSVVKIGDVLDGLEQAGLLEMGSQLEHARPYAISRPSQQQEAGAT